VVPPVLVCLALAYLAYEAWVETIRERDEIRALYEVERHLLTPIESTADIEPVLEVVRRMLRADRVELSLLERDGSSAIDGPASVVASADDESDGAAATGRTGAVSPHVAMVQTGNHVSGMLIVHREEPLDDTERTVLETVASKISVMLRNNRLYRETLEQAELADVVSHTWDGIFVVSPEGSILSWNPSMERITGLSRSDALGRSCRDLLGIDLGDLSDPAEAPSGRDLMLNKPDGAKRWLNYSVHRLGERGGQRNGVVVVRDVTAELETDQLKADFVATVSHELRTPLTPLKGFLITLLHGVGDGSTEERQAYYQIMLNQANRLERLITDLLEASRIESGEPIVDLRPLDLGSQVRAVVDTFVEQYPDRRFSFVAPDDVVVEGDPLRIDQIVTNLVSNAIKYSPRSEPIDVIVSTKGPEARVEVRDRGQGIAPHDRDRIFERFFRVDNALTRSTGGTGLGLYLAKKLAAAMQGRLEVSSLPGRGSTFTLTLPRAEVPAAAAAGRPRSAATARSNGRGRTRSAQTASA
jgi:PAS domain S-box-containing protein